VKIFIVLLAATLSAQNYDVVLQGGRVLDPESRLDGVRNVGVIGDRIAAVSTRALRGKLTINITGLVVVPGFIDLHSHGQDDENYRFKAKDGVTTTLELEAMGDASHFIPRDAALNRAATTEEQSAILAAIQRDLNDGGLGVGLGIEFAPKTSPAEVLDLFHAAARWLRPILLHLRRPGAGVIESLQEVIADAAVSGVAIHVMPI